MKKIIGKTRFTAGQVARRLDVSLPRLQYLITKFGVQPIERCGTYRLFSLKQLNEFEKYLSTLRTYKEKSAG